MSTFNVSSKAVEKLKLLPHSVYEFTKVKEIKAVLLASETKVTVVFLNNKQLDVSGSCIRRDKLNNIWIKNWYYQQNIVRKGFLE